MEDLHAAAPTSQTSNTPPPLLESQSPQPVDLLCVLCGERGGRWQRGSLVGHEGWVLEKNQRIATAADESGRYIYTHICDTPSLVDVPGVGLMALGPIDRAVRNLCPRCGGPTFGNGLCADDGCRRQYVGPLSGPAGQDTQEQILCELVFAAKVLAEDSIETIPYDNLQPIPGAELGYIYRCRFCQAASKSRNQIDHHRCQAGRVLRTLRRLENQRAAQCEAAAVSQADGCGDVAATEGGAA